MAFEYTETLRELSPFIKLLGLEVIKLENGTCQLSMIIKDNFLNIHKTVHSGVIYSLPGYKADM